MNDSLSDNNISSNVPEGVEFNEASRFVDYTFATPWEVLVGNIERTLKDLIEKFDSNRKYSQISASSPSKSSSTNVVEYDGYKFGIALEEPNESVLLSTWFGLNTSYITVCHRGEWRSDADPSSRRTFFSAVVTALSDSNISLPVLFIPSTRINVDKATEILGYRIERLPKHRNLPYAIITHYESIKEEYYDRTSSFKHHLFYLDGAFSYFRERLLDYTNKPSRLAVMHETSDNILQDKSINVEVIELYNCASSSVKFMATYHYNESSFIPREQSYLLMILQSRWQFLRQALKYRCLPSLGRDGSSSSPVKNQGDLYTPVDIDDAYDDDIYPLISPLDSHSSMTLESIKSLDVVLSYQGTRLDFRVDNHNYTTMHPSKQPPSMWSCKVGFTFHSQSSKPATNLQLQQQLYGHEYSNCIRNLLGNYLISRSTITGVSMANLFGLRVKSKDFLNVDKIKNISSNLSLTTKDLIDDLTTKIINAYKISISRDFHSSYPQGHQATLDCHMRFMKTLFSSDILKTLPHNINDDTIGVDGTFQSISKGNSLFSSYADRLSSSSRSIDISNCSIDYIRKKLPFLEAFLISSESTGDVGTPAISWMTLLSIYSSTLSGGLWAFSSLWSLCLRHLRETWEQSISLPNIFSYHTTLSSNPINPSNPMTLDSLSDSIGKLPNLLLCKEALWDDAIQTVSQNLEWKDLSLPCLQMSLFNQKLQMLQFCIAMKDQESYLSIERNDRRVNVLRRLPLTDDAIGQYYRLTTKIKAQFDSESSSPDTQEAKTESKSVNDFTDTATTPRRPSSEPSTSDTLKLQQQFQYQILYPSLISDIRAFKAAFPSSTLNDFSEWYGFQSNEAFQSDQLTLFLREIWKYTEGCPASDQKPLFRTETEAEKCLQYFELITPSRIYSEMIAAALPAFYTLISYDITASIIDLLPICDHDDDLNDACQEIINDLTDLRVDIDNALRELRLDTGAFDDVFAMEGFGKMITQSSRRQSTSTNSDNASPATRSSFDSTASPQIIPQSSSTYGDQLIYSILDRIERKYYRLEEFLLRYRSLTILLTPPAIDSSGLPANICIDFKDIKKLAMRLWNKGQITAKNETEAQVLLILAKNSMIPGSLAAELASAQGRELSPLKKTIIIKKPLLSADIFNQLIDESVSEVTVDESMRRSEDICHRLTVDVNDESIRASFSLIDFDC